MTYVTKKLIKFNALKNILISGIWTLKYYETVKKS
jgi:hypothetical protein